MSYRGVALGGSDAPVRQIVDLGPVTVPTPGTPVQITSAQKYAVYIEIQAPETNSGLIAVGSSSVRVGSAPAYAGRVGVVLQPGESRVFYCPDPSILYVDAETADDGVTAQIGK